MVGNLTRARTIGPLDPFVRIAAAPFVLLLLCGMMWIETQRIASLDGFRRADLGASVIGHIYAPWKSWEWMSRFDLRFDASGLMRGRVPRFVRNPSEDEWAHNAFAAERSRALLEVLFSALVFASIVRFGPRKRTSGSQGHAYFATISEILRSSLAREKTGVVLGQEPTTKQLLVYKGDANVLALGPPGTGKSTGIVIPTLLGTWRSSAIVFDPAAELAEKTAHCRENVLIFDPRDPKSARFDPLHGVAAADIDEIRTVLASYFFDREADEMSDGSAYFIRGALELGIAVVARVLERIEQEREMRKEGDPPPPEVGALQGAASYYYGATFKNDDEFCDSLQLSGISYVAETGSKFRRMETRQRSSVIGTLTSFLDIFRSGDVARSTSGRDFSAADLRAKSTTLYVTVRERDAKALTPLIRMVLTRLFDDLTVRVPKPNEQSIMLLLDEFPLLRAPVIQQKLGTFRKYRVHPVLLAQTLTQIVEYYGQNEVISGLCDVRVYFPTLDERTQESASNACGQFTQWAENTSIEAGRSSRSLHEAGRALLLPSEMATLGRKIVIVKKGEQPFKAIPVSAHSDARFASKLA